MNELPPSPPDASQRKRAGWVPATVILLVIFGLVCAPLLLALLAPTRAEGTVGVYERITLRAEDGANSAIGGFIAPQGWARMGDEETEGDPQEHVFVLDERGRSAIVTVSLRVDADDAAALLREDLPAGAALAPVQRLDPGAGPGAALEVSMLEFDLQAGGGVTQRIAACSPLRATHCLLFEVSAEERGSGAGDPLPEVRAMVQSAEVL